MEIPKQVSELANSNGYNSVVLSASSPEGSIYSVGCVDGNGFELPVGLPAFILFTTLGSAIWNSILVLLGYYLAQILPEDRLLEELERYSREISYVFVALVTLALITWYLKRKLKACR